MERGIPCMILYIKNYLIHTVNIHWVPIMCWAWGSANTALDEIDKVYALMNLTFRWRRQNKKNGKKWITVIISANECYKENTALGKIQRPLYEDLSSRNFNWSGMIQGTWNQWPQEPLKVKESEELPLTEILRRQWISKRTS